MGHFFYWSATFPNHIRHQGIFYLLMITVCTGSPRLRGVLPPSFRKWVHRWVVSPLVSAGFFADPLLFMEGQAIWAEVKQEQSSVKRLAEFINQSSPNAILMPEPGYLIEAFPYYSGQRNLPHS